MELAEIQPFCLLYVNLLMKWVFNSLRQRILMNLHHKAIFEVRFLEKLPFEVWGTNILSIPNELRMMLRKIRSVKSNCRFIFMKANFSNKFSSIFCINLHLRHLIRILILYIVIYILLLRKQTGFESKIGSSSGTSYTSLNLEINSRFIEQILEEICWLSGRCVNSFIKKLYYYEE